MRRLALVVLAAALAASACSVREPGRPTASSDHRNVNETISPGDAPPIDAPYLDLSKYADDPCVLLEATQLRHFDIAGEGGDQPSPVGVGCIWHTPDLEHGASVGVTLLTELQYDWEGVHDRRDRWPVFQDGGEVSGYPVVHLGDKGDTEVGECTTLVGVNPDLLFETKVFMNDSDSPEYQDPCSQSDLVAEMVIDTVNGDE